MVFCGEEALCGVWVDGCGWMVSGAYKQPQKTAVAQRPCSALLGVIDSSGPLPRRAVPLWLAFRGITIL